MVVSLKADVRWNIFSKRKHANAMCNTNEIRSESVKIVHSVSHEKRIFVTISLSKRNMRICLTDKPLGLEYL